MIISHNWLQSYFEDKLPEPKELRDLLIKHSYEVEGLEEKGNDWVYDIDVLPNRGHDSLGHLGIAREVAVLLDQPMKEFKYDFPGDPDVSTKDNVSLNVDTKFVPRAMKRLVVDVKVGESPQWMKDFLESIGQQSINNIVDTTNLVMYESSQPIHAFDYDKLAGDGVKNIHIRHAKEGETVDTLDGKHVELDPSMIVVADDEKPLDLAGIKGGANSGVDEDTKRIVISVCNFDPVNIRKTRMKTKVITDASRRFEQHLSPELTEVTLGRACMLFKELGVGKIAADVLDYYPKPKRKYKAGVRTDRINSVLGTDMSDKDVEDVLDRFKNHAGFEWEKVKPIDRVLEMAQTLVGKKYKYGASFSYDAPEQFDCSSFVAYLFGNAGSRVPRVTIDQSMFSQKVEESDLKPGDLIFSRDNDLGSEKEVVMAATGEKVSQKVNHVETREFLPGTKLDEPVSHVGLYLGDGKVIHASNGAGEVSIEEYKDSSAFENIVSFGRVTDNDERYVVTIPHERLDLGASRSFYAGGVEEDLIEEIGRVYGYDKVKTELPDTSDFEPKVNKAHYYITKIKNALVTEGFSELMNYPLVSKGEVEIANPMAKGLEYVRANLSDGLEVSLEKNLRNIDLLGSDDIRVFEIAKVYKKDGERWAMVLGAIKTGKQKGIDAIIESTIKATGDVIGADFGKVNIKNGVVEFDLEKVFDSLPQSDSYDDDMFGEPKSVAYKQFSNYPAVSRDISAWVPDGVSADDFADVLKENAGELLVREPRLFDEFAKDGRTSYAFKLVFQSFDKTLTDVEVNEVMEKIYSVFEGKNWEVR